MQELKDEEVIQIGKGMVLEADRKYLWHIRGEPMQEAKLVKALMEKYDLSQLELAKEIPYTQPYISKLLSLLSLEPVLQEMINNRKMGHTTGYRLAKLPSEYRMKVLAKIKAEGRERIYHRDVDEARSDYVVSEDILELIDEEDPPDIEAWKWWRTLSPERRIELFHLHNRFSELLPIAETKTEND